MKKAIPGTNSNKNSTMKTNIRDSTNIIQNVFSTLTPKKKTTRDNILFQRHNLKH